MQPEAIGPEIEAFGHEVIESSGRSLELLQNIETTINYLSWLGNRLTADCRFAQASINSINRPVSTVVDVAKAENAIEVLERAQTGVHKLYEELIEKRGYASADTDLHPEDGVVDAFSEAVTAAADLHNTLNTLRWAISELVVDSETGKPKVYVANEVDKFLADLKR